jgi:hypothetical protein
MSKFGNNIKTNTKIFSQWEDFMIFPVERKGRKWVKALMIYKVIKLKHVGVNNSTKSLSIEFSYPFLLA